MASFVASLRSGNPRVLAASFLYFDMSFMAWVLLGALGNFIAADLGLSGTEKGLVTAVPILSGSLLRLVFGFAAERFGARHTGMAGLALTLLPLLIGWAFADSLPVVYFVGALLGVAGASFAVALPMASRWYPPETQGLALGIAGAGNSGTVLASLFAPRLAEVWGWQAAMGLMAIPIALTLGVFAILARDHPQRPAPATLRSYRAMLARPDTAWFSAFYAVTFGGFVGLASFLALFLKDEYGLSKVHAGDLTALCVFAGSFARPFGGLLSDRLGGQRVLLALYLAAGAVFVLVGQRPSLMVATPLIFAGMGLLGMGNGAVFQLIPQRFGGEMGLITGVVGTVGGVGGFFLPVLLGATKDISGSYGAGFVVFGSAAVAMAGLLLLARRGWNDEDETWAVATVRLRPSED